MLRKLLFLSARVGRPGAGLTVGDSDGRRLYLEARTEPLSISVPLERDQVRQLVAVCSSWLAERDRVPTCAHRPGPAEAADAARYVHR